MIGDMDSPTRDNPYSTPTTTDIPQIEVLPYFRRGNLLFIRDGAELPNRCIRTNEEIDGMGWHKRKLLTWIPQWAFLFIVAGFLPFVLLAVVLQKKAKITYSLSKHARKSLFRKRCIGLGLMAFGVLGAFAAAKFIESDAGIFIILGCILMAFVGLIISISVNALVVRGAKDGWFHVKGCSEEFLAGLPEA